MARRNSADQSCRPPQVSRLMVKARSQVSTVAAVVSVAPGPRVGIDSPNAGSACAAWPMPDSVRTLPARSLMSQKASPPSPVKCG